MPARRPSPAAPGLTASQEMRERARGFARVLNVPPSTFAGKDAAAYHPMSHLPTIPSFRDSGRRNRYLNEILPNAGRLFPAVGQFASEFVGVLGRVGAEMQTFPAWFTHLTQGNNQIVHEYRLVTALLKGMGYIGMAPIALVAPATQGAIGGARSALGGMRAVIAGAVQGGATNALNSVTGGLGRRLGVVWVIGTIAAQGMQERQQLLAAELVRRFNENRLSVEQYRRAMGDDAVLPYVYYHRVR